MSVTIFVPDLEEFLPVVESSKQAGHRVLEPVRGYWRIEGGEEIRLRRKEMGLGPALWNSALIGGIRGRIVSFDKDEMVIRGQE